MHESSVPFLLRLRMQISLARCLIDILAEIYSPATLSSPNEFDIFSLAVSDQAFNLSVLATAISLRERFLAEKSTSLRLLQEAISNDAIDEAIALSIINLITPISEGLMTFPSPTEEDEMENKKLLNEFNGFSINMSSNYFDWTLATLEMENMHHRL